MKVTNPTTCPNCDHLIGDSLDTGRASIHKHDVEWCLAHGATRYSRNPESCSEAILWKVFGECRFTPAVVLWSDGRNATGWKQ